MHKECVWVKAKIKVNYRRIQERNQDSKRNFSQQFPIEVGTNCIKFVVSFSQKNWTFFWKNKDYCLGRIERDSQQNNVEAPIPVHYSFKSTIHFLEQNVNKNCCNNTRSYFNNVCIWQAHIVKPTSLREKVQLE